MDDVLIAIIEKNSRERLHVSLREFKGHVFCDVRLHWLPTPGSEAKATHKGVTVRLDKLAELRQAIEVAEAKARELGLL